MKKIILFLFALLAGFSFKARASHDIGGSLTYMCVGPNTYLVTYSHYSWSPYPGSGGNFPFDLRISAPGCNNGRIIPLVYKSSHMGSPVPAQGNYSTYYIDEAAATVTFTPAEAACKNWVLGVSAGSRLTGANQALPSTNDFVYTEATLKLDANINNSSPVFDPQNEPVLVAAAYQPITLSVGAYDQDGDSLVYRMVAPLTAANQPIVYRAIGGGIGGSIINPNPLPPYNNLPIGTAGSNPQFAFFPPGNGNYSATYPISSYKVNWNRINPATGVPYNPVLAQHYFDLDASNGSVSFTPMVYDTTASYNNSYVVAFQVDEYRTINGVATKIGSVRRETFIMVGDAGANTNPRLSNLQLNNVPVQQQTGFTVSPGSTFSFRFDGADNNTADSVNLASNALAALPGATFTVNAASRQTGTITWTPTAAQVRSQPYFLRIWVKDNASPFAGKHVETIAIHVSNRIMAIKPGFEQTTNFTAYPNPFTEVVVFKFKLKSKAESIVIYNLLGQQVDKIALSKTGSGEQSLQWHNAGKFASGTYVARLISEDKTVQTLKFTKLQ